MVAAELLQDLDQAYLSSDSSIPASQVAGESAARYMAVVNLPSLKSAIYNELLSRRVAAAAGGRPTLQPTGEQLLIAGCAAQPNWDSTFVHHYPEVEGVFADLLDQGALIQNDVIDLVLRETLVSS